MSCCASERLWNEEKAQLNRTCCVSPAGGWTLALSGLQTHSSSLSVGTVNASLLLLSAAPLSIDSRVHSGAVFINTGVSAPTCSSSGTSVRDGGHNYINGASLVGSPPFKSLSASSRFLPLPLRF